MSSLILQTATRVLMGLLLLFSIFLLLRGHNLPGGGFIGGLTAAASFALYALAHDVRSASTLLGIDPRTLIGLGLGLAVFGGMLSFLRGRPFLTGLWDHTPVPVIGKFGTPLIFDVGVYVLVVGFTLLVIFTIADVDPGQHPLGEDQPQDGGEA